jgi:amidase
MDLDTVGATEAVARLARGEVGSEELLDAQLARVEALDGELNLITALDVDRARARCRQADAATARGERWGPLHGLPITIKDSFETEGLVTTAGAKALAGHVPDRDADAVALLKAAGAVVFAKTNLPLYAGDFQTYNDLHGLSRNPWDPGRTVGGSSGGAAAAVACGMTLLELGSDIGGSIRCPAHYNGVAGHKPTLRAVPERGHIPGPPGSLAPPDLAVMGPLARTVADLALALDVLTGPDLAGVPGGRLPPPSPARASLEGLRVAVWAEDPAAPTSREVTGAVRALGDRLADAGAVVDDTARPGVPLEQATGLYLELLTAALAGGFPPGALAAFRAVLEDPDTDPASPAAAQARGALWSHAEWLAADERRHRVMARWAELFERVDVVISPCAPVPAFPHDTERSFGQRCLDVDGEAVPYLLHVVWAGLASLPLLPATAVPVTRSAEGLPIGVQVVGPRWGDRTTLAVAALVESVTGGFAPPPRR